MKRAFTLVELIFVLVIVGILAAVAIPKFSQLQDNARITAELSTAASVQSALESCHGEWVVNEGNFTCGYDINSSDLNSYGYPPADQLGSGDSSPLSHLLKNADNIGWSRNSGTKIYYGPASDPSKGTTHCLENKPCKGRCWIYDDGNGTFKLETRSNRC